MTFLSGKSDQSRGFTLIELLVVISIIGFLSTVVLASLASARGKAKDAAIKQSAMEMRKVYELEYSNMGSYVGLKDSNYSTLLCSTNTASGVYSCNVSDSAGCTSFYRSGTEGEKICKDLFNKGVVSGGYTIATKDSFLNTYIIYIQYPSNANLGRCISNSGYINDVNALDCKTNGL